KAFGEPFARVRTERDGDRIVAPASLTVRPLGLHRGPQPEEPTMDEHHDDSDFGAPHEDGENPAVWAEATRPPTGICFVGSFEGRALITCDFNGAPAWFASEIAAVLGLGGTSELARRLAIDWADSAALGVHWVRL